MKLPRVGQTIFIDHISPYNKMYVTKRRRIVGIDPKSAMLFDTVDASGLKHCLRLRSDGSLTAHAPAGAIRVGFIAVISARSLSLYKRKWTYSRRVARARYAEEQRIRKIVMAGLMDRFFAEGADDPRLVCVKVLDSDVSQMISSPDPSPECSVPPSHYIVPARAHDGSHVNLKLTASALKKIEEAAGKN